MKRVQFRHTKQINKEVTSSWDVGVFNTTFKEYNMQVQLYQEKGEDINFTQLVQKKPQAEAMQYKIRAAASPYIDMLAGDLLDVKDITGKPFMRFQSHSIELIESKRNHLDSHHIVIDFISEEYIWVETIGNQLVVQKEDEEEVYVVRLNEYLTLHKIIKEND